MEKQRMQKKIAEYAKNLGFIGLGFVKARPFLQEFFQQSSENQGQEKLGGKLSTFVSRESPEPFWESLLAGGSGTFLCLLAPCPNPHSHKEVFLWEEELRLTGRQIGRIAASSWGRDYHAVVKEKLEALASFLEKDLGARLAESFVDTVPVSERGLAVQAGLGAIGRNSNFLHSEFGSFVFLAEILTDLDLSDENTKETVKKDYCGDCHICVDACPVGAIDGELRLIDTRKCLSQQTQEKEKKDPQVLAGIKKTGYLYGCDICQLCCPWNRREREPGIDWKEFQPVKQNVYPDMEILMAMSNKEFKRQFGQQAFSWRGRRPIVENCKIILGLYSGSESP